MTRDFAFTLREGHGRTHAIGATHVGLDIPGDRGGMYFVMTTDEARRLSAQIDAAAVDAESTLPTGLGEREAVQ